MRYRVAMLRAILAAVLVFVAACGHGGAGPDARPIPTGHREADAREVLHRFARAVRDGRWPEAYALLSDRWRAAYTPGRLAADHAGAAPVAQDAAARVLALLSAGTPLERDGARLTLPVGGGRAAALVAERGGWRVDALE